MWKSRQVKWMILLLAMIIVIAWNDLKHSSKHPIMGTSKNR